MEGAAADHVAIDDDRGVDEDTNQRVAARSASSSRIYSGARPPLKKIPAYSSGLMSLKAMSELMV